MACRCGRCTEPPPRAAVLMLPSMIDEFILLAQHRDRVLAIMKERPDKFHHAGPCDASQPA